MNYQHVHHLLNSTTINLNRSILSDATEEEDCLHVVVTTSLHLTSAATSNINQTASSAHRNVCDTIIIYVQHFFVSRGQSIT